MGGTLCKIGSPLLSFLLCSLCTPLQAYEIDKNNEKGNGLVVVRLDSSYSVPDEAYGIGAKWVYSFNLDDILEALEELKN